MVQVKTAVSAAEKRLDRASIHLIVAKCILECPCSKQDLHAVMQTIPEFERYTLPLIYRALLELYDYGIIERVRTIKPGATGPKPSDYFKASNGPEYATKAYILSVEKFLILPSSTETALVKLLVKLNEHMKDIIKQLPSLSAK